MEFYIGKLSHNFFGFDCEAVVAVDSSKMSLRILKINPYGWQCNDNIYSGLKV